MHSFLAMSLILTVHLICHPIFAEAKDSIGEQSIAVLLIDLKQDGKEQAKEEIAEAIFSTKYSLANYVAEASYGRAWVTGQTYGWFRYSGKEKKCELSMAEIYELIKGKVNLAQYNRWFVFYHLDEEACNNGLGHSTFGLREWNSPIGPLLASASWITINNRICRPRLPLQKLSGMSASVVAHEFGHALGLRGHSNLLDCGEKILSAVETECKQEAIADTFTLMGGDGVIRPSLHYNACHKEELGWFSKQQLQIIKPVVGGKIQLKIYPYISAVDKVVAIKIPLKKKVPVVRDKNVFISSLYLTFRTAKGFDRRLIFLENEPQKIFDQIMAHPSSSKGLKIDIDGIQIHGGFFKDGHCVTTYLLDAHPNSIGSVYEEKFYDYSLYDALDSFLLKGEDFFEPYNNIHIKLIKKNEDGSWELEISG